MFHHESICHPDKIRFQEKQVECLQCQTILYNDVNDFLKILSPYLSVYTAQCYANATGDLKVRCRVPMEKMPGILPKIDATVQFDVLYQVVRILGIMNSCFVSYNEDCTLFQNDGSLNMRIIEGFIDKFRTIVDSQMNCEEDKLQLVRLLKIIMAHVEDQSKTLNMNIIDQFCNIYAPYAKCFAPQDKPSSVIPDKLIISAFRQVNADAHDIREKYSPFSLQLDLIYVMVYVFLFSDDMEIISNIILRLVSDICRSKFKQMLQPECQQLITHQLAVKKKNTIHLFKRFKNLQREGCREHISLELMQEVKQFQEIFSAPFEQLWCSLMSVKTKQVIDYAEKQMFPAILFPTDVDYYGFMIAFILLSRNYDRKTNMLRKHSIGQSKIIIDFVKTFIQKFNNFQAFGQPIMFWTIDTFKLFMATDEFFTNTLIDIIKLLQEPDNKRKQQSTDDDQSIIKKARTSF